VDRFRANGFQVDGASDSENTYLVEGLDTSNIQGGGVKQNVIFDFVQEVQVKDEWRGGRSTVAQWAAS